MDAWEMIEAGRYVQACRAAEQEAAKFGSIALLNNKVIALMALRRFGEAIELINQIAKAERWRSEADFVRLGVSHWLLQQQDDAITAWRAGRKAQYTDDAGGMQTPLLLFFASVVRNDEPLRKEAIKDLRKLCKRPHAVNWPGAIGAFVLGKLTEEELQAKITKQPILRPWEMCQAWFYIGVMRRANGDMPGFMAAMRKASGRDSASLFEEEYFLARGALAKTRRRFA